MIPPQFLSAEPLANNLVAITTQGAVDFSDIQVSLNGKVDSYNSECVLKNLDISPADSQGCESDNICPG